MVAQFRAYNKNAELYTLEELILWHVNYISKSVLKKKDRKFGEFSISQNNHSRGKPETYTFTALQPGSRYAPCWSCLKAFAQAVSSVLDALSCLCPDNPCHHCLKPVLPSQLGHIPL